VTVIPGATTVHEREAWEEAGYRMAVDFTRTPSLYVPGNVTRGVAHYTGALNVPDGDAGEDPSDVAAFLRRAQRDYLINRTGGGYTRRSDGRFFPGYPLGYNFGVDWLGGAWVLRGFDFLPAATNGHNGYTIAVLLFVDGANPATAPMWETARAIVREARRRSNRPDFNPVGTDHGSLRIDTGVGTPTACAGAGIRAQLSAEFDIDRLPVTFREGGSVLHTVSPKKRIADTRSGAGGVPVGIVAAGKTLRVPIPAPPNTTPRTAIVNVTITDPTGPGYGLVDGLVFGDASDLNFAPGAHPPESGATIAAIVDGAIGVRLERAGGNVVVDLLGVVD
jgi:hypothetical protein